TTVILVEGERDVRSLRRLGVRGTIMLVHHGNTISEVAEEVARRGRRVIVMTDWDTEGGRLAQRLKEFLGGVRLELDLDSRRKFARVLRGEVVHVEGLAGWARRNAERYGGTLDDLLPGREGAEPF
ncbi:MAG: toprim domain-containing protein, partial [Thermoplasmata archaeon]|nr:toprim domain-containing protein [Thermoplasmata archaeon]